MDTLLQDLRYAVRSLSKSPAFAAAALLTLALGIGANTAIFSVVNGVLLRPLPFQEPGALVRLFSTKQPYGNVPMSAPDFLQYGEQNRVFEEMAAYTLSTPTLTGVEEPTQLEGSRVSASFFKTLGITPTLGRTFRAEDNEPDRHLVVVLGHGLWQQRFGGDRQVVGRAITLNGRSYTVVGVMPRGFDFPDRRELWMPLAYDTAFSSNAQRAAHYLDVIARLKPGVSIEQANADVGAIAKRIEQDFPDLKTGFGATTISLREQLLGDVRTPLLVLLGAVGFVLLIACANVANLMLARAATRESELSVRTALGAGRGRLVRQMLTESLLLAVLGGAVGLLLAGWGTEALVALQPQDVPRVSEVRLDWTMVAFTAGLTLLTGVLFGLIPALQVTRADLIGSLKEGGRGALSGRSGTRVRGSLVMAEIALAVMLLAGAGLLIRSFVQLQQVDPGFRSEQRLAFEIALPGASYGVEDPKVAGFYTRLLTQLRSLPGVRSVGAISSLPMTGNNRTITFDVEGREPRRPGEEQTLEVRAATPDYFGTMGIPLRRGRGFAGEDRAGRPAVVLLSESAAQRYFPNEDPLGRRIQLGWRLENGEQVGGEVVGIVGDVKQFGLDQETQPGIYVPHAQVPENGMEIVLRAGTDPLALAGAVRQEVKALDVNLPISNVRTLDQLVARSVARPRFYMLLLTIFAVVALALATVGIFGVMSYSVAQRTREIGIRMALGATSQGVLHVIVGRALRLVLGGMALGLLGTLALGRVLSSLLFGISATDPVTYVGVAAMLASVALLASYLPARRAARVDPVIALRAE